MTRTIKEKIISGEQIKKEKLEFICNFNGILLYAKQDERYYLIKLLSFRDSYQVMAYQDGVK